jgi:hypothetical protein
MHFVLVAILSYFDSLWPPFENDSTYLFFYAGSFDYGAEPQDACTFILILGVLQPILRQNVVFS